MSGTAPTLLVVAKAPVPGAAKTRLMSRLDGDQAAAVAAAALLDTLDAVAATPAAAHVVALTGDLHRAARSDAVRRSLARFVVVDQRGDGFGARLVAAHADAAAVVAGAPVLQIGMDTPQVGPQLLSLASTTLLAPGVDAVLGPAEDGGWWALGVRDPALATALTDVAMSTPDTGELTLRALRRAGATVSVLPALRDVDTPADAAAVAADTPGSRFALAVHSTGLTADTAPPPPRPGPSPGSLSGSFGPSPRVRIGVGA